MFENPLCFRDLPLSPLFASWGNWEWVKTAFIWVLMGLLFWGIRKVYRKYRLRRRECKKHLIYILPSFLIVFLTSFLMVSQGWFLPIHSTVNPPAIVVLGRGETFRQERVDFVTQLWQQQPSALVFLSGRIDTQKMTPLLLNQGIPKTLILGENCSATTSENAIFSAIFLKKQRIKQAFLMTDRPHLWRSTLEFWDEGLEVIPYPIPLPKAFNWQRRLQIFWREYWLMGVYWVTKVFPFVSIEWPDQDLKDLIQKANQYQPTLERKL